MDPLTHGFTGALLADAFFVRKNQNGVAYPGRLAVSATTIGAVFPDCDFLASFVQRDGMATLEWHRGVTHSILCLPLFAAALTILTIIYLKRRGRASPHWFHLAGFYAAGLASHIFLDVITSWGTMVWSPLSRRRVGWDLIFIIDLVFTAIVLAPQLVAWVYASRRGSLRRALAAWGLLTSSGLAMTRLVRSFGLPVSLWGVLLVSTILAALLFLPYSRGWGFSVPASSWCRAGLAALGLYLLASFGAHRIAFRQVEQYARSHRLAVDRLAAVPMAPSLLRWEGLIRTAAGVHRATIHLLYDGEPAFRFIPDALSNGHIAAARALPRVQTYLWFARFPSIQYFERDGLHVIEFSDLRFSVRGASLPAPYTFRVVFDATGTLVEQGWAVEFE